MIVGFNKNCNNALVLTGLLTLILSGCGGGGPEDSPPTTNNSSVVTTSTATTASAVISSSAPATSNAASSVSSVKSSLAVASSEPAKPINSSSSQSSYTRSSRASSQAPSLDDFDLPPLEDDEEIIDLPPTAPRFPQVDITAADGIVISWQASTDDIGLARYEIRRDGVVIGTINASQRYFEDVGLKADTYYTYTVRAIDIAGNHSSFSDSLVARTTPSFASSSSAASSASSSVASSAVLSASSRSADASSESSSSPTSPPVASSTPSSVASSALPTSSLPSSSTSSSASSHRRGARIEWATPSSREDGSYLELNEIGGYEIRYRPVNSSVYLEEIITDRYATTYERIDLTTDTIFQIAVFDTNGLYSRFIQLIPY
jgi:hypothetical protein